MFLPTTRKGPIPVEGSHDHLPEGGPRAAGFPYHQDECVIITGVVQSAPSGEAGVETVSLEFAKVDWQYKPQTRDGSLDAGISFKFDIKPSPSR